MLMKILIQTIFRFSDMSTFIFKVKKDHNGRWPSIDFGSSYNEARFADCLKENDGKLFKIENQVTTRSLSQNALYWMYLGIIEQETGNVANDMHEYFRRTLLLPVFVKVFGKEIKIPSSTKGLSKTAFGEYIEKIVAATNVPIPDTEDFNKWKDSSPLVGEEYSEK